MSNFYSKVECWEVPDTAKEVMTSGTFNATVSLHCLWENRIALMVDLLKRPSRWPYWSGPVYCSECTVAQDGGESTPNGQLVDRTGSIVKVDCTYSMVRWQVNEEQEPTEEVPTPPKRWYRSVKEDIEISSQMIQQDAKNYRWGTYTNDEHTTVQAGDPLKNDQAPGLLVPGQNLVRTLSGVEELPQDLLGLSGHCNHMELVSPYSGLYYPPESLMFLGANLGTTYTEEGFRGYDITMRFAIQMAGWNNFYNPATKQYQPIIYVPTEGGDTQTAIPYKPYTPSNFKWLLYMDGWEEGEGEEGEG